MKKKIILLLIAAVGFIATAQAQIKTDAEKKLLSTLPVMFRQKG